MINPLLRTKIRVGVEDRQFVLTRILSDAAIPKAGATQKSDWRVHLLAPASRPQLIGRLMAAARAPGNALDGSTPPSEKGQPAALQQIAHLLGYGSSGQGLSAARVWTTLGRAMAQWSYFIAKRGPVGGLARKEGYKGATGLGAP